MNEFEKIYLNIIAEEVQNDELNSSTELVDQNEDELTNESLGKWAKNTFLKFGKKSVQAELQKTIKEFINMYKFSRFDPDKLKTFGKIEDGYLITVKFDITDWKHAEVMLSVISPKSKRPVQDFQNVSIKIKHSYTEKEIADKINGELSEIDIEITTNSGKVPADFFEKNNNKQQSQGDIQQKTDEAFNKVATASGFETETFKEKLSEVEGDKTHKISMVKSLISGWKKLDENERKIFQQLQN